MGFFDRLKQGLTRTRDSLTAKIETTILGYADIDEALLDDLEEILLMADVGVATTEMLMKAVRQGIKTKEIKEPGDLISFLEKEITALLTKGEAGIRMAAGGPTVLLVVGVNGAGKTTTIGKLSAFYHHYGKKVMLAAADTFRAAAIDQLEIWGQRTAAEVIRHEEGSDPAAVVFDAVKAAKARAADVLIVDTAGRKRISWRNWRRSIGSFGGKFPVPPTRRSWCWTPPQGRTPSVRLSSSLRRPPSPASC